MLGVERLEGSGTRRLSEGTVKYSSAVYLEDLKMSSLIRLHRGQYGRSSVTKSSKPYKHFLPTYSPQEGYLKESEDVQSIKELLQNVADYSKGNEDNHERYQYFELDDTSSRDVRKEGLFQHFYQVIKKERDRERPSDCIIVSTDKAQREYAIAIGHRLQDHGLVVEMIHLTTVSGLSRALQEVKDDGSPFCILVEQSNVNLYSCTLIVLHESIKRLVNPKGLFPPPLLAAPSKRPAPLGCPPPKPAKRPLLGEKPGLLAPPPGLSQLVLRKQTLQPMPLLE
ncbi:Nuclear receptor coactivator 5 [Manis javanica]|nr:Nuclear receptor coactivator 5 [Manis javanica]